MRVFHALMLVIHVTAEEDESVLQQSQKVLRSHEEPSDSNDQILYVDETTLLQQKSIYKKMQQDATVRTCIQSCHKNENECMQEANPNEEDCSDEFYDCLDECENAPPTPTPPTPTLPPTPISPPSTWHNWMVDGHIVGLRGGNQGKMCLDGGQQCNFGFRDGFEDVACYTSGIRCIHGPNDHWIFQLDHGSESLYTVVKLGQRTFALRSNRPDGKYCTVSGQEKMHCQEEELTDNTKFRAVKLPGNDLRFALESVALGKYCEDNGSRGIICNRDKVGSHEAFEVFDYSIHPWYPSIQGLNE